MTVTVRTLFLDALALPASERAAFLDSAAIDVETRMTVDNLLAAAVGAEDYCDGLAKRLGETRTLPPDDQIPDRLGPYSPIRLIGRGGMGAVYLAERVDEQFEKEVAVKILPSTGARQDVVDRFLTERQILAKLVHPNICRLLDGGLTADGRPYFVMDYVDGKPIDEYCDSMRLTIRSRLQLFCQVCAAVSHAHANLILHRDLKPGNILVDERGSPQLLDFGVSAWLHDEQSLQSDQALTPLTPSYVSPEVLCGRTPTTASDVYSLGVILYRLLTGIRPHEFRNKSLDEALAQIRSSEPALGSRRLMQHLSMETVAGGNPTGGVAEDRATSNTKLVRLLKGDIDAILRRALRIDPRNRYQSVSELVADIQAHLDQRPVTAMAPTFGYRLKKFFSRYRARVFLGVLAVFLLISLAGLALQFAVTTSRQSEAIAAQRDRAESVSEFLLNLFKQANPRNNPKGSDITAKELVDIGVEQIQRLADDPETQAELMSLSATAYGHMNQFESSKALLVELLSLEKQRSGPISTQVGNLLDRISTLEDALGDWEASENLALDSVEIRKATGDVLGMASTYNRIGRMRHVKGDYDQARNYYEQALALYRSSYEADHAQVAQSISHLASLALHQERFEEAEALHSEALAMRARLYGENHLSRIESLLGLAQVLHKKGDLNRAGLLLEQAVSINDHFLGPGSRNNGYVFNTLAQVKQSAKAYAEAAELFQQSIAIWRSVGNGRHPVLGTVLGNLGKLRMEEDNADAAIPLLEESLSIVEKARPDHWQTAELKVVFGSCLTRLGNFEQAESYLITGRAGLARHWGEDHAQVLLADEALQRLYARQQVLPTPK